VIGRLSLRVAAVGYLAALVALPLGFVFWRSFEHGLTPAWNAVTTPDALHALRLSIEITAIAVVANTIFGVICAMVLVRTRFRGSSLLSALVDLPFAISPVVVGLALLLLYGRNQRLGLWLIDHGITVIFSVPGMVLATIFISLPFVVREVAPVLRELGTEQEEAAATLGASPWQAFWRVTLPAIRPAIAYGVVLTAARSLGEFGAVSIISGRIVGQTETLPLRVQDLFEGFDVTGAYATAVLLALLSMTTLVALRLIAARREG
jgi:sulfate/thiosulfate transport system permease protein